MTAFDVRNGVLICQSAISDRPEFCPSASRKRQQAPECRARRGAGITSYLSGLPEELYAVFCTGYLGYTAARQWGEVKETEV